MMNSFIQSAKKEFGNLSEFTQFNKTFINENAREMEKVFYFVYVINLFKNRVETKQLLGEKFSMTYSLLLESSYALYTGQVRASLLLLRSAQEACLKFMMESERQYVLEKVDSNRKFEKITYRFNENKKNFIKELETFVDHEKFEEYYKTVERTETFYKKLCGVVHANSENYTFDFFKYYENIDKNMIVGKNVFFSLYINSLKCIFELLYFVMRASLKKWDTYELTDILSIVFRNPKKVKKYIKYVKG